MSARNNGHGRPTTGRQARRNRTIAIVVVVALVLVAFGIGYVLASGGDDDVPVPASLSGSSSLSPSASPEPSEGPSEEASESVSAAPAADLLPDGRSFVYAKDVSEGTAGPELTFDLAYYLTDEAAQEAADAAEDELTNGYYIVNDNPTLRTMPLSLDAVVRYVPEGTCCNKETGDLDAWIAAVNGIAQTDYPNMEVTGWWIGVEGGVIVRITQQWVP